MSNPNLLSTQEPILVIGDAMLDLYWSGEANRLSPEAPVPVISIRKTEPRLGGAANVALNVARLGAPCALGSLIGQDGPGLLVKETLESHGVKSLLAPLCERTIQKIRLLAQNQQIARVDFEDLPSEEIVDAFASQMQSAIAASKLVILSDYGKGSLFRVQSFIREAAALGIPTLIDPKGDDFEKYRGATVITPNKAELKRVVGSWQDEAHLHEKAQNLRASLGLKKLLLTRSEEGMTLFDDEGAFSVRADAKEVFDVSGAGDTVIAVLGVALLSGMNWKDAVTIANKAGGIVVGKLGTAAISREELLQ